jgi:zinc protease
MGRPHLSCEELRLDNGLRVILHPDRRLPRVVVNLLYRVGSRDDPSDRAGLAHLLEHLMFMGTRRVPVGQFDMLMEQVGGWCNAFTSEDHTVYYEAGPARLLETLLWMEADRMEGLGRALTASKLDLQRDVVLNELFEGYHNRPYGVVDLELPRLMYSPKHPYGRPIIGSEADLRAVTVGEVRAHHARYYAPANASLVVAGDLDPRKTAALARRHFGWIGSGTAPARPTGRVTARRRELRRTYRDTVELPRLMLSWHSPPHFADGDAEMDLVGEILAGGKHARLHRALVHNRRLALRVQAYQLSRQLGSQFSVVVTARSGVDPERLERQTRRELEACVTRSSGRELRRVRARFEAEYLGGLQHLRRRAELLNLYAHVVGDRDRADTVAADLGRYRAVSVASLRRTVERVLGQPPVVVWVLPGSGRR